MTASPVCDFPVSVPATHRNADRPRMHFLDGIRGFAASYVAISHTRLEIPSNSLHPLLAAAFNLISFGRASVAAFIVLSGFCLMLPVAKARSATIPDGVLSYIG